MKPYRGVFAEMAYGKGKLELVPETSKISLLESPTDVVFVCSVLDELTHLKPVLLSIFSDTFCVPAWAVRHTDDASKGNMGIQMHSVKMTVEPKPKSKGGSRVVEIMIPVMVNTAAVKENDELLFYKPAVVKPAAKQSKRHMQVALESVAKQKV